MKHLIRITYDETLVENNYYYIIDTETNTCEILSGAQVYYRCMWNNMDFEEYDKSTGYLYACGISDRVRITVPNEFVFISLPHFLAVWYEGVGVCTPTDFFEVKCLLPMTVVSLLSAGNLNKYDCTYENFMRGCVLRYV